MNEQILAALEQKLAQHNRNQLMIDQMKKLDWKGRTMVFFKSINYWRLAGIVAMQGSAIAVFLLLFAVWGLLPADEIHVQCPDPGVKCKVLFLNPQEEQMLMIQNGILDTAAQGRSLDLGQFSVYLKTRIGAAPQGEIKPMPAPPGPPKVDSGVPANVTPN